MVTQGVLDALKNLSALMSGVLEYVRLKLSPGPGKMQ